MKNYNEVAADVLLRRDKYNEKKKIRRKRALQLSAVAVCFAAAAVFAAGNGNVLHLGGSAQIPESLPCKRCAGVYQLYRKTRG